MVKVFSCVPPLAQENPVTPESVYGPPGPVSVKSASSMVLHKMFSVKLKVREVALHETEPSAKS